MMDLAAMPRAATPPAYLIIHGFTATPYSVHHLADALRCSGHAVSTPLLPGHGLTPLELSHTSWEAWADAVAEAFIALRHAHPDVVVVGQSLGGLLALHLAADPRFATQMRGVVTLAAPLWLEGLPRWVVRLTRPGWPLARLPWVPKLGGSDVRDPDVKRNDTAYRRVPIAALQALAQFMGHVDHELPNVRAPLMVMHSRQDHTAPPACAGYLACRARAEKLVWLSASYHLLAVDVERDRVYGEIAAFGAQLLARRGA